MKHNKGLAAAVIAVMALFAVPACALASTGISAGSYPSTLAGSALASESHGFKVAIPGGFSTECSKLAFSASLPEHSNSVSTSSVTPEGCKIEMNGCNFELNPGGKGSLGIGPAKCGPVRVSGLCASPIEVPAQSLPATYENVGSGKESSFNVTVEASGAEYVRDASCGSAGTHHDLVISGKFKVTTASGTNVLPGGLRVGGGVEGKFQAVKYPEGVSGESFFLTGGSNQVKPLIAGSEMPVSCESAKYNGTELTAAAATLTLNASYSNCSMPIVGVASVAMNSCRYVYSALKQVGETESAGYWATAQISCNEGDAISISAMGCTLKVPAQTLSGGEVGFATIQPGYFEPNIGGTMTAKGMTYTTSGSLCTFIGLPPGTYTNGVTKPGGILLRGVLG